MAEVRHSTLTGADLHGSKVVAAQRTRQPSYEGELIWDGSALWVGMGGQWLSPMPPTPPVFSWAVSVGSWSNTFTPIKAALYYADCTQALLEMFVNSFVQVGYWTIGSDWNPESPIDITPYITKWGKGVYIFVLLMDDNGIERPAFPHVVSTPNPSPARAVSVFEVVPLQIQLSGNSSYNGNAIEVKESFAQVSIHITQGDVGS